jgi:predicted transcriptional regulator YdeE
LIGLKLNKKTINANGQSNIDCGELWQKFELEKYFDRIPNKLNNEILAVYYEYESDHTKSFSYFIGCKVKAETEVPGIFDSITIPKGTFYKILAKGKMPYCVADAWAEIWKSDIPRAYEMDFEVYDERSKDWSNAQIDIFLSVK